MPQLSFPLALFLIPCLGLLGWYYTMATDQKIMAVIFCSFIAITAVYSVEGIDSTALSIPAVFGGIVDPRFRLSCPYVSI